MKVSQSISPILTPKLVDMAMSLERSQKEGQISNLRSNIYHTVKNLVKIYQVVPQIICLKGFIFLKTRGVGSRPRPSEFPELLDRTSPNFHTM